MIGLQGGFAKTHRTGAEFVRKSLNLSIRRTLERFPRVTS